MLEAYLAPRKLINQLSETPPLVNKPRVSLGLPRGEHEPP